MYTIVLLIDGKFHCRGRMQSDSHTWIETDLKVAIKKMKDFARVCNAGHKIKKKDIVFLQERVVQETKLVPWDPNGTVPKQAEARGSKSVSQRRPPCPRRQY